MNYKYFSNAELIAERRRTVSRWEAYRQLMKTGRGDEEQMELIVQDGSRQEDEARARLDDGRMTEEQFENFLPF